MKHNTKKLKNKTKRQKNKNKTKKTIFIQSDKSKKII